MKRIEKKNINSSNCCRLHYNVVAGCWTVLWGHTPFSCPALHPASCLSTLPVSCSTSPHALLAWYSVVITDLQCITGSVLCRFCYTLCWLLFTFAIWLGFACEWCLRMTCWLWGGVTLVNFSSFKLILLDQGASICFFFWSLFCPASGPFFPVVRSSRSWKTLLSGSSCSWIELGRLACHLDCHSHVALTWNGFD